MPASDAAPDPRLVRGVADFNAGNFFEAHEVWEELWNDSEGDAKRFVQALVQLAAGYHKLELGVRGGARKLLERALATLDLVNVTAEPDGTTMATGSAVEAASSLARLDLETVREVVRRQLDTLRRPGEIPPWEAPRLEMRS